MYRFLCHAVVMGSSGRFQGPAGEPQDLERGEAIVSLPDGKGAATFRKVDGDEVAQTYTAPDGSLFDMALAALADFGGGQLRARPTRGFQAKMKG